MKYLLLPMPYIFIYFERERVRERELVCMGACGGGAEREGDRGSEAGSRLWAQSLMQSWTQQQWDHDPSQSQRLNWLSHPGPLLLLFFNLVHLTVHIIADRIIISDHKIKFHLIFIFSSQFFYCFEVFYLVQMYCQETIQSHCLFYIFMSSSYSCIVRHLF